MIKTGERDERLKDGIFFLPPPSAPQKGSRRRSDVDATRSGPVRTCMPSAHTGTTRPAGRRHMAEKVIPQSEMATKAPAQWYPFVKAVAIKGP